MLIDDIRLGESAELEFKRVQRATLKAKGVVERMGGTRGSWRIVLSRRA